MPLRSRIFWTRPPPPWLALSCCQARLPSNVSRVTRGKQYIAVISAVEGLPAKETWGSCGDERSCSYRATQRANPGGDRLKIAKLTQPRKAHYVFEHLFRLCTRWARNSPATNVGYGQLLQAPLMQVLIGLVRNPVWLLLSFASFCSIPIQIF